MTRTNIGPRPFKPTGKLERALEARDAGRVRELIYERTAPKADTDCLCWTGVRSPNGYGMQGRPTRYVHRLLAWSEAGFPGTLSGFPQVHHRCGVPSCVRAEHLAPVTAYVNVLESQVRRALTGRISTLEAALAALDPENELLSSWPALEYRTVKDRPSSGDLYKTLAEQLRLDERRARHQAKLNDHRLARYKQVLEVRRLQLRGLNKSDAIDAVGLTRSVFDEWNRRLDAENGSGHAA